MDLSKDEYNAQVTTARNFGGWILGLSIAGIISGMAAPFTFGIGAIISFLIFIANLVLIFIRANNSPQVPLIDTSAPVASILWRFWFPIYRENYKGCCN